VDLRDVNDNTPVFTPSTYSTTRLDTVTAGTSITRVSARDADSGQNANVTFAIVNATRTGQ